MTTERLITWAETWVAIRIASHSEESGNLMEVTMAMEAVTGVPALPSAQKVLLGLEQPTMVRSMLRL